MDFSLSPLLPVDSLLCASFNGFIGSLSKRWPICFSFPNQLRKLCRRRRQKKKRLAAICTRNRAGVVLCFSVVKKREGDRRARGASAEESWVLGSRGRRRQLRRTLFPAMCVPALLGNIQDELLRGQKKEGRERELEKNRRRRVPTFSLLIVPWAERTFRRKHSSRCEVNLHKSNPQEIGA